MREPWLTANGVFGLFPAAQVDGDDIEIYADESARKPLMTWHNLRQQNQKPAGHPNLCLADFVAPKDAGCATTSAPSRSPPGGIEERVAEFEAQTTTTARSC